MIFQNTNHHSLSQTKRSFQTPFDSPSIVVFWVYHTPMIEPKEIYFLTVFLLVGPLFNGVPLTHHFSRFHSVSVWGDAEPNTKDLDAFSFLKFWFLWFPFNLLAQLCTQLLPNIIIMIEANSEFLGPSTGWQTQNALVGERFV